MDIFLNNIKLFSHIKEENISLFSPFLFIVIHELSDLKLRAYFVGYFIFLYFSLLSLIILAPTGAKIIIFIY